MKMRVIGTGSALPDRVLTNDDLAQMVDTNHDWIVNRTGIHSRHIIDPEESGVALALSAANRAMEMAGIAVSDLRMIVVATITSETLVPSLASTIAKNMGAACPAFDINAACSGFLYALNVAMHMLPSLKGPVLVVGSELLSRITDWEDRGSCILFGDGVGAVVVDDEGEVLASRIMGYPDDEGALCVKGINALNNVGQLISSKIYMDGKVIFRFATKTLVEDILYVLEKAAIKLDAVKWYICHQANGRILKAAAEKLGVDGSRFYKNIETVGNTSAASVPIALDALNRSGQLKRGELVLMAAFGGGLTSAAMLLRW